MLYSRRKFLAHVSLGLGAAAFVHPLQLLADTLAAEGHFYLVAGMNNACEINLTQKTVTQVPLGFIPHSFIAYPQDRHLVWAIEKWGTHAAVVDFRKGRVVHAFESPKRTQFYGHGIFYPQKNAFFVTRVDSTTGLGHLVGYDADTFQEAYDYQVTPAGLHECHLLPDETCLVTSSGVRPQAYGDPQLGVRVEKTGLVHVNMRDGKVLDKKLIDDDGQIIGHFGVTKSGALFALSTPRPMPPTAFTAKPHGRIYRGSLTAPALQRLDWLDLPSIEPSLLGEMLSIAVNDDQRIVAVTNPGGKNIFFINSENGNLLEHQKVEGNGIVYDSDNRQFIFSGEKLFDADEKGKNFSVINLKGAPVTLARSHTLLT